MNAATVLGLMHIMEVSDVLLALHAVLYGASGGAFIALVSSIAVRILSKDLLKSRCVLVPLREFSTPVLRLSSSSVEAPLDPAPF